MPISANPPSSNPTSSVSAMPSLGSLASDSLPAPQIPPLPNPIPHLHPIFPNLPPGFQPLLTDHSNSHHAQHDALPDASAPLSIAHVTVQNICAMVPVKLNPDNYLLWRSLFVPVLRKYKVLGLVDGTEVCPSHSDPEFAVWYDRDQSVLIWLNSTIAESLLNFTFDFPSSRLLWVSLEMKFAGTSPAQIQTVSKGDQSMTADLQTIKELSDATKACTFNIPLVGGNEKKNQEKNQLKMWRKPLEKFFGGGDELLWHKDLKPYSSGHYSIAVVQANNALEDQGQVFTSSDATYIGVYDGHGGPEASRFISSCLFPFLHKFSIEQGGLSEEVIRKAFNATEEEFLDLVKQAWPARPQFATIGSCCLVGAIANGVLYVANLGDSRAVLGRRGSEGVEVVAERLSTDHNVGVAEVRNEVKDLHPDDADIVVFTRGVWRIKGIIQISRSIGDAYLKKPEFNREPLSSKFRLRVPLKRPLLTAEPSILVRTLQPEDMFLIFATDGLWEHLSDEAAVEIVSKNSRVGIAKRLVRAAVEEAARKREMRYDHIIRVGRGVRRFFHDDITVIVIFLDHSQISLNASFEDQSLFNRTFSTASSSSMYPISPSPPRCSRFSVSASYGLLDEDIP